MEKKREMETDKSSKGRRKKEWRRLLIRRQRDHGTKTRSRAPGPSGFWGLCVGIMSRAKHI